MGKSQSPSHFVLCLSCPAVADLPYTNPLVLFAVCADGEPRRDLSEVHQLAMACGGSAPGTASSRFLV